MAPKSNGKTGTELAVKEEAAASIMERVMVVGDLAQLEPVERVSYYHAVCESVGLNPLTQPFEYIRLNGKLTLYARKGCTDQLRQIHKVSIGKMERETSEGVMIVTAHARTLDGREDTDVGAVTIAGLKGEALANAIMKAITKAKRRVTLSICGLGWLDETEIEAIPSAAPVQVSHETGEIVEAEVAATSLRPTEAALGPHVTAEPEDSPLRPHLSAFQRQKITELYAELAPGRDVNVWFLQNKGHSMSEATYDEGREATKVLLERKRALAAQQQEGAASVAEPAQPEARPLDTFDLTPVQQEAAAQARAYIQGRVESAEGGDAGWEWRRAASTEQTDNLKAKLAELGFGPTDEELAGICALVLRPLTIQHSLKASEWDGVYGLFTDPKCATLIDAIWPAPAAEEAS